MLSLASFAGLARPVGSLDREIVSTEALPSPAADETAPVAAARKVTVAKSKHAPDTHATTTTTSKAATTVAKAVPAAPPTKATTPAAPATTPPAPVTSPPAPPTKATTPAAPTTTRAAATTTAPPSPAPSGWQTIFEDNFDGGGVNSTKWTIENRPATNMGEISFYASDDVFVRDGSMIVRSQNRPMGGRSFTTGQAVSKFDFQYGRVEIRAKMPVGQGFWPALWMLPTNGATSGWLPEIDIYESINRETRYFGNYHFPTESGQSKLGPVPVPTDVTGWHVYGLEWTPDRLSWTLDGDVVISTTNVAATRGHRMFLLITFALGGAWPGPPDATTPFPAEMQIDYVRVMQLR